MKKTAAPIRHYFSVFDFKRFLGDPNGPSVERFLEVFAKGLPDEHLELLDRGDAVLGFTDQGKKAVLDLADYMEEKYLDWGCDAPYARRETMYWRQLTTAKPANKLVFPATEEDYA